MANNSVKIRIDGDTSGFEKTLSGIEKGLKKTISAVVKGTAVVGTAFAGATVAALNFSGELEQNLGGSEAVFKEYAKEIQDTADKAFKNMGLSASDFLATANKMGALFQGAGFSIEESADISAEAMQRAADVASIMGIDVSVAMESIAGAAKGNFTMMDNLGVAMNDTTLNAYALEIGLGKTTAQMTNQEKVALAMEMFLDRTAYAAGNYAKENNTLAGSLQTAKAALENFMAGTGSVDEVVESLTNAADVIIRNLGDLVPKLVKGVGELVENLMGQLVEMIADNAPQMIEAAVDVIAAFIEGIGENADKIAAAAATIIQTLANAIIRLIPQIIEVAGEVMKAFAQELANAFPLFTPLAKIIEFLTENIKALTSAIITGIAVTKGLAIIQRVGAWYTTTKTVLAQYTAAMVAYATSTQKGATINKLLLSSMKPLEIAVGVLTGKIKAQTVATYALAAAKKALRGVLGLVVSAIAAVVAGTISYISSQKDAEEATAETVETAWSYKTVLDEIRESLAQSTKTFNDSIASDTAKAETVMVLKDRLFELENQINSGKLSEEEAVAVKEEFGTVSAQLTNILPTLAGYIGNETNAYILQRGAIDSLAQSYVQLAKAKAFANAYEEKMTETAKAITEMDSSLGIFLNNPIKLGLKKNDDGGWTAKEIKGSSPTNTYDYVKEMTIGEAIDMGLDAIAFPALDRVSLGEGQSALDMYNDRVKLEKQLAYEATEAQKYAAEVAGFTEEELKALGEKAESTGGGISTTARTTADDVNAATDSTTDAVKKAAEEQGVTVEQMLKNELRNIERAHKLGIISDKEYYDSLTQIRDKYFDEGSEDWQSYTEEIENYYDSVLTELAEKIESKAKDFQDETNKTYATITLDADGEVKTWNTLADMDSQNARLDEYLSLLKEVKEARGDIPKQALAELQNMDTEEAIQFLKVMRNASDEEWNNWTTGIEENVKKSEELSKELYADEISENQELIQKLKDEWGEVPADFFKIGEDCAAQYGEGFKTEIEGYISTWQNMLYNAFSTVPSAALNYNVGQGGAAGSTTYTDNRTTNIYANGTSPRAIIEAQNQSEIYQAHTSTFGG